MQQIFVSNRGDDSNSGLSRDAPIYSWKRLLQLSRGNAQWVYIEGDYTRIRLEEEAGEKL
jgi:hypothetical protein